MALISMKMSKEEKKECMEVPCCEQPDYPYGLCLDLNDEAMEKLGITTPPSAGTEVTVVARAFVRSTSAYDRADGEKSANMSLQITDMEIGPGSASKAPAATMLYGDD